MKQKRTQKKAAIHHRAKHRAKLWLVPHKHNKYQPHLVRSSGLIAIVLLAFAVQAFYNFSNTGSVLGGESTMTSEQLLKLTNDERANQGLSKLALNTKLNQAATLKANDMLAGQYWSHTSPSGTTPWQWFDRAKYDYSHAGENLAKNFTTTQGVVTAWMHSSEHRKNILGAEYQDVGFAVVPGKLDGENTRLVVALYGAPKVAGAAVTNTTTPMVLAAIDVDQSPMTQFGARLQSMAPAALASIVLLLIAAAVAATAHLYRKRLPKPVLKSWRRHHGLYKAVGMASLAVVFITLYGGGQI